MPYASSITLRVGDIVLIGISLKQVISNDRNITEGNLKNQAYENNFYGEDIKVEEALSQLEHVAAIVISQIINSHQLPQLGGPDHVVLFTFVIFQSSRTTYQAETINESIDKFYKTAYKEDPRFREELKDIEFGFEYPATFSLGVTAKMLPIVFDLTYKLVINKTKLPFITSDNPVVKYNQFLEKKQAIGGISGLAAKGLQIFIPLNPVTALIIYDANIYKVGNRKQRTIYLSSDDDINGMNLLQFANANGNLYFNEVCSKEYIQNLIKLGKRFSKKDKVNINEYFPIEPHSKHESIIHLYNEDVRTSLVLSFIKLTESARRYQLGNRSVHVRDQGLIDKMTDANFKLNLEKGIIAPNT